jgi:hypothetical protein
MMRAASIISYLPRAEPNGYHQLSDPEKARVQRFRGF